jgi:hypothetical protein
MLNKFLLFTLGCVSLTSIQATAMESNNNEDSPHYVRQRQTQLSLTGEETRKIVQRILENQDGEENQPSINISSITEYMLAAGAQQPGWDPSADPLFNNLAERVSETLLRSPTEELAIELGSGSYIITKVLAGRKEAMEDYAQRVRPTETYLGVPDGLGAANSDPNAWTFNINWTDQNNQSALISFGLKKVSATFW